MLSYIGSILAWVAGIVVLVKLFQKEGFFKGLLGFICMIYTYIWGWMHVKDGSLNLKTWMWIWTGAIVVGIILNFVAQASANVTADVLDALQ